MLQRLDQQYKAQDGQDDPDDDLKLAASRLDRLLDAAKQHPEHAPRLSRYAVMPPT